MPIQVQLGANRTVQQAGAPNQFQDANGATADAFGGGVARSLQGFGGAIESVAGSLDNMAREDRQKEQFAAGVADDTRRQQMSTALTEAQQKMPETGDGFAKSTLPELDRIAEENFAKMPAVEAEKYRARWQAERIGWERQLNTTERTASAAYAGRKIEDASKEGAGEIAADPTRTNAIRERVADRIRNAPNWTDAQKQQALDKWDEIALSTEAKGRFPDDPIKAARALGVPLKGAADPVETVNAAKAAATKLGVSAQDLLTVASFETGGTFSTSIRGGSGNRHIGVIQFGKDEQVKYGAYQGQPVAEQWDAVVRYMQDRGVKPGMGLREIYAAVNTGSVSTGYRSDTANGGTPGSADDKVRDQMGAHKARAEKMLASNGGDVPAFQNDPDGRYKRLPYETRQRIVQAAETQQGQNVSAMLQQERADRYNVQTAAANDIASVRATGQGVEGVSASGVAAVLGPAEAAKYTDARDMAHSVYTATQGFESQPAEQVLARVAELRPTEGGADYAKRSAVFKEASEHAEQVIKQRFEDPAQAVESSPGVVRAREAMRTDRSVMAREDLIAARLDAQKQLDVPQYTRSPIPLTEAREYASKLRPLARGQADVAGQESIIEGVVKEINDKYGRYAGDVLTRVLYQVTLKKDAAEVLSTAIQRMTTTNAGPLIRADEARRVETEAQAHDMASAAGALPPNAPAATSSAPSSRKPYSAAVEDLRKDPDRLLPFFIQKYGIGAVPPDMRAAGQAIADRQDDVQTKAGLNLRDPNVP